jgi:hypothetical protein
VQTLVVADTHADTLNREERQLRKVLREEQGVSTVTYVLLLPLFVLLVFGSLQIWRIISIKQSLHVGTYQSVRCISMYDSRNTTLAGCESLLKTKLAQDGLLDEGTYTLDIDYRGVEKNGEYVLPHNDPTIDLPQCGDAFRMKVRLALPWSIVIPYLPARDMTLREWKTSYIECSTGWSPISEETPVTPLN